MVKKQYWLIIVLIIGIALGIPVGRCSKPAPEIKTGTTVERDSVVLHDTVYSVRDSLIYLPRIDVRYVKVHDTVTNTISVVETIDTTPCYSIEGHSPRGSWARAQLCSKLFPVERPLDLSGNMDIRDAPDTLTKITRVDTVQIRKPFYTDWRTYALTVLTGIIAAQIYYGR